jgi:hypothetical protein
MLEHTEMEGLPPLAQALPRSGRRSAFAFARAVRALSLGHGGDLVRCCGHLL